MQRESMKYDSVRNITGEKRDIWQIFQRRKLDHDMDKMWYRSTILFKRHQKLTQILSKSIWKQMEVENKGVTEHYFSCK